MNKDVKTATDSTSSSIGDLLRSTANGIGFGTGMVMAKSVLTGPTSSGFGSIISETLMPYGKQLENFLFQGAQVEARAAQSAREQTISAMGWDIGKRGMQPSHMSYFTQLKAHNQVLERGRSVVEQSTAMYGGVDMEKAFTKLGEMITSAFERGVDYLWEKIKGG